MMTTAVRCAFGISKARDLSSRGQGKLAIEVLNEVYRELSDYGVTIDCNLLRAQVAIQIEDGPLTLASAEAALAQLESGEGRYRPEDRKYLIEFSRAVINYCDTWRYQQDVPSDVNMSLVNLSKVSPHLRRNFPLPKDGSFL